jgi:hypothetical protein
MAGGAAAILKEETEEDSDYLGAYLAGLSVSALGMHGL